MSQTRVQFINHSSVLVQNGDSFILTDPWFQRPAFGSWLPQPPMFLHPAYLTALAKDAARFYLLISHGHDDHIDDELVALFAGAAEVVIPRFKSPGLLGRVGRLGFEAGRITQVGADPVQLGPFTLRAHFNDAFTHDDALVTVGTADAFVVHANDNWRVHPPANAAAIRADGAGVPQRRWLYMSQCNAADGFPFNYPQFSADEQRRMAGERVRNIIRASLTNALDVGAGSFLHYAGHTTVFVRGNEALERQSGPRPIELLREQLAALDPQGGRLALLDLRPGDTFDFETVERWWGNAFIRDDTLKEAAARFYRAYGLVDRCDTFRLTEPALAPERRAELARGFLRGFDAFISKRVEATNYHPDVVGTGVLLATPDRRVEEGVVIGGGPAGVEKMARWTRFEVEPELLDRVLTGAVNAENLFIGGEAAMVKSPADHYNGGITFWLSKYAYVYQREQAAAQAGAGAERRP